MLASTLTSGWHKFVCVCLLGHSPALWATESTEHVIWCIACNVHPAAAGNTQPVDEQGNTLLHLAVQHAGRAEVAILAKHKDLCTTRNHAGDLPVRTLPYTWTIKLAAVRTSSNATPYLAGRGTTCKRQ